MVFPLGSKAMRERDSVLENTGNWYSAQGVDGLTVFHQTGCGMSRSRVNPKNYRLKSNVCYGIMQTRERTFDAKGRWYT